MSSRAPQRNPVSTKQKHKQTTTKKEQTLGGWNRRGTCKMLPCKKRRLSVTESSQQQDDQEGDDLDLEAAVKPDTDQLPDSASESLSWGQSQDSAVCPEGLSMQDGDDQLRAEGLSLNSKMLAQHVNLAVLEAVDVAVSQEIPLPSLESSHSLPVHVDKGRLQVSASKKGKRVVFTPGQVTREDRGDHPVPEEPPSGEPAEEAKTEGGELELRSDGEVPLLSSSSQSAKPGAQPRKSVQPDGSAFPQDKPLGPLVRQAEEEMEDGGLFIPTGRLFLFN